jgi:ribosome maturation factor RimP
VEYVKEGAEWYLRITLDSDDGIDIDDCEKVSRAINPIIDEADPIEDFYYLEVSSPGLERVLRKPEHFEASIGSEIEIRLFAPDENKKKAYTGTLSAYDGESLVIDIAEESKKISLEKISKVQTVFDFSTINMNEN